MMKITYSCWCKWQPESTTTIRFLCADCICHHGFFFPFLFYVLTNCAWYYLGYSFSCRHLPQLHVLCSCVLRKTNVCPLFFYYLFHTKVSFMSNQKQQKPTLTGQRFKTRKRGLYPPMSLSSDTCSQTKSWLINRMGFFLSCFSLHQMKRRDLTLLSFKKVSYKAWTKLALIWTQLQSSWMPLAPSSTTADMQRHSLTSLWPAECWVSRRHEVLCRV